MILGTAYLQFAGISSGEDEGKGDAECVDVWPFKHSQASLQGILQMRTHTHTTHILTHNTQHTHLRCAGRCAAPRRAARVPRQAARPAAGARASKERQGVLVWWRAGMTPWISWMLQHHDNSQRALQVGVWKFEAGVLLGRRMWMTFGS
eukprot:1159768-Pelagomonas_calceolata.AAC.1